MAVEKEGNDSVLIFFSLCMSYDHQQDLSKYFQGFGVGVVHAFPNCYILNISSCVTGNSFVFLCYYIISPVRIGYVFA